MGRISGGGSVIEVQKSSVAGQKTTLMTTIIKKIDVRSDN